MPHTVRTPVWSLLAVRKVPAAREVGLHSREHRGRDRGDLRLVWRSRGLPGHAHLHQGDLRRPQGEGRVALQYQGEKEGTGRPIKRLRQNMKDLFRMPVGHTILLFSSTIFYLDVGNTIFSHYETSLLAHVRMPPHT